MIPPAKITYYNLKYKHKALWHCKLWLEALLHKYCGALIDVKRKKMTLVSYLKPLTKITSLEKLYSAHT